MHVVGMKISAGSMLLAGTAAWAQAAVPLHAILEGCYGSQSAAC